MAQSNIHEAVNHTVPIVSRAADFADRIAIIDRAGSHSYAQLLDASARAAGCLLDGTPDLREARVAFLVPSVFDYVLTQWGIWRAGGVAVPLCQLHPPVEWEYTITDSGASIIVADASQAAPLREIAKRLNARFVTTDELGKGSHVALPAVDASRRAMMLYTSGTTSKPKGVVTTHATIAAQVQSLVDAWEWTSTDHILHVLPLHHIHGVINVLCCAMWAGACCEMLPKFDAEASWDAIASGRLTLFMAVPTVYTRLTQSYEAASDDRKRALTAGCAKVRVMVCGSAALPVTTLEQWRKITGHTLLERYGMTEIGMGLSNSLRGERYPGCVGKPLPMVQARLVDEQNNAVPDGSPGEIQIKGPTVFSEYWGRPDATREAFVDGWFRTGDVAVRENGVYRILGRSSIDIIKTGGYKVSALEIEEVLREHESVQSCAVVGVPDAEWGERVAAIVVLKPGCAMDLDSLRAWAKSRLAVYKVPTLLRVELALPLNAMGKVVKPELKKLFEV